jgi:exopolysaccharide biosynthesis polyprenyl glycosylphosphotransferase
MSRRKELLILLIGDFIAINSAWVLFYWLRFYSGWFANPVEPFDIIHPIRGSLIVYGFWIIAFIFFGLYKSWYVRPIFDELITIIKTLAFGTIIFMFVVLWDPFTPRDYTPPAHDDPRIIGLLYFIVLTGFVITFRLIVRYTQRRLLESGIGQRPSLIIGSGAIGSELASNLRRAKRLGYNVLGYISSNGEMEPSEISSSGITSLGKYEEMEEVIKTNKITEVLIALNSGEHTKLLDIIGRLSAVNVGLKIVPDLYDIISGQARTREIYGFPLIDINPEIMRPWEEAAKRGMDIMTSLIILIAGLPLWILVALGVGLTSRGPIIYSQGRMGKNGLPFKIFKFRSMTIDAEKDGPQWAQKNDPRVTTFGKFIRKVHLDEVPQFWNVLKGDMSLVGPRPEREYFVEQLSKEIPYYRRRLKVRPGITGLFQAMVYKYDENLEDVRNKLKYDLMYIESMSFRLDLKIIFRTAYMMFKGKGQA